MNLENRVVKLESRGPGKYDLRHLSDETLERIVREYLLACTREELEADLVEHPECRELYRELAPPGLFD